LMSNGLSKNTMEMNGLPKSIALGHSGKLVWQPLTFEAICVTMVLINYERVKWQLHY